MRDGVMPHSSSLRTEIHETRDGAWPGSELFGDGAFGAAARETRRSAQDEADERLTQLARVIELEIVPRLMLAHRTSGPCADTPVPVCRQLDAADVHQFARLVLQPAEEAALEQVARLCEDGLSAESIYLDLLAPAARHLGELWERDLCDFTQVTLGLGRLQRVLRALSASFHEAGEAAPAGRRVLLLPCPGEQHTFGLVMVSEFFRRAGWEVAGGAWEFDVDAASRVASDWYDVIGFSLAGEVHLDELNACIDAVRRASRNRAIGVIVGGPLFGLRPEFRARVAADLVAVDGRKAPQLAEQLLALRGTVAG